MKRTTLSLANTSAEKSKLELKTFSVFPYTRSYRNTSGCLGERELCRKTRTRKKREQGPAGRVFPRYFESSHANLQCGIPECFYVEI